MQTAQILNLYKLEPYQLFSYINEKTYKEINNKFVLVKQFMNSIKDDEAHDIELTTILFAKLESSFEHLQRIEEKLIFNSTIQQQSSDIGTAFRIPADMLKVKHHSLLEMLTKIRAVCNNYNMKDEKSTYYNLMLNELYEIETLLHEIITIKENILFREVKPH